MRILALAAVLFVAGCSSSGGSSPPPPSTPTGRFLALVHSDKYATTGGLNQFSDADLLAEGQAACATFLQHRPGRSDQQARSSAVNDILRLDPQRWLASSASALVDAADLTLC